ncbi:hypothetical protein M8009_09215 [Halomonas sp. ATCH28]|uniref:Uncharacterized protein n=1 Tax=Halomonas gemina TaxID=2945105 RepID=A0ABT0T1Q3_9GAMM|nr:hypothetical protein [Halomonas gemina]MCL7940476.1 hypothetical protein [Halomonas gemina]
MINDTEEAADINGDRYDLALAVDQNLLNLADLLAVWPDHDHVLDTVDAQPEGLDYEVLVFLKLGDIRYRGGTTLFLSLSGSEWQEGSGRKSATTGSLSMRCTPFDTLSTGTINALYADFHHFAKAIVYPE